MESEVDLQNKEIKKKSHDLFNLKGVNVDLFAFLVFWAFREYSGFAFKFSFGTREALISFCFISFKKKAERPLWSHDSGRKSSKESAKLQRLATKITTLFMCCSTRNLYSATCGFWSNSWTDNPSILKVPLQETLSYVLSFLLSHSA